MLKRKNKDNLVHTDNGPVSPSMPAADESHTHDKSSRRKRRTSRLLIAGLIVGLTMLAWPIITDLISAWESRNMISEYTEEVKNNPDHSAQLIAQGRIYNTKLSLAADGIMDTTPTLSYEQQLALDSPELSFGWLEIPILAEELPIYHGTSEKVLQVGVGHLEGTSLPIGGISSHAVLTGHSGMPGCRMFDDIRLLHEGDLFFIHVLNETMTYEVKSVETVLPEEVETIKIVPGKDMVTLVTCTPYGINSHRLLVHAERRIPNVEEWEKPHPSVYSILNMRTIPFIIAILVVVGAVISLIVWKQKKKKKSKALESAEDAGGQLGDLPSI